MAKNTEGLKLNCKNCSNEWYYKGTSKHYATCSKCLNKVRIAPYKPKKTKKPKVKSIKKVIPEQEKPFINPFLAGITTTQEPYKPNYVIRKRPEE